MSLPRFQSSLNPAPDAKICHLNEDDCHRGDVEGDGGDDDDDDEQNGNWQLPVKLVAIKMREQSSSSCMNKVALSIRIAAMRFGSSV